MGPAIVVVANGDNDLARGVARDLAGQVWAEREHLCSAPLDARAAVAKAMISERLPVILVDCGDNVGGGSAGDGTVLLEELLRKGASGFVVCLFAPHEVRVCQGAGVGSEVSLVVGGKVDQLHGRPIAVTGQVRLLHDGTYIETQPRHGGRRLNQMGPTALVEMPGRNLLVLTTERHPPFSLGQLTCLGIEPARMRFIVVKAAVAYKAAYGPIAGTIIDVDTPGVTAVNPARFSYQRIRRPMFPFDKFDRLPLMDK
jgi:microcystin degradation protein MlrC